MLKESRYLKAPTPRQWFQKLVDGKYLSFKVYKPQVQGFIIEYSRRHPQSVHLQVLVGRI